MRRLPSMSAFAIIAGMKDYVMREKLRMRAYNAMVDYMGAVIRCDHPDLDRVMGFRPADGGDDWLSVDCLMSDKDRISVGFPFSLMTCTQLVSGEDAADAADVGPYSAILAASQSNGGHGNTNNADSRQGRH